MIICYTLYLSLIKHGLLDFKTVIYSSMIFRWKRLPVNNMEIQPSTMVVSWEVYDALWKNLWGWTCTFTPVFLMWKPRTRGIDTWFWPIPIWKLLEHLTWSTHWSTVDVHFSNRLRRTSCENMLPGTLNPLLNHLFLPSASSLGVYSIFSHCILFKSLLYTSQFWFINPQLNFHAWINYYI